MLLLALALGCSRPTDESAVGEVHGRTWSSRQLGVALDFGEGWAVAVDPQHFRSELPGTVLEGRHGELSMALTWQPLPGLPMLAGFEALDLLPALQPVDTQGQGYLLERVPGCPHLVERHAGELVQLGMRLDDGLLVFHGWGEGEPAPMRELACGARPL